MLASGDCCEPCARQRQLLLLVALVLLIVWRVRR